MSSPALRGGSFASREAGPCCVSSPFVAALSAPPAPTRRGRRPRLHLGLARAAAGLPRGCHGSLARRLVAGGAESSHQQRPQRRPLGPQWCPRGFRGLSCQSRPRSLPLLVGTEQGAVGQAEVLTPPGWWSAGGQGRLSSQGRVGRRGSPSPSAPPSVGTLFLKISAPSNLPHTPRTPEERQKHGVKPQTGWPRAPAHSTRFKRVVAPCGTSPGHKQRPPCPLPAVPHTRPGSPTGALGTRGLALGGAGRAGSCRALTSGRVLGGDGDAPAGDNKSKVTKALPAARTTSSRPPGLPRRVLEPRRAVRAERGNAWGASPHGMRGSGGLCPSWLVLAECSWLDAVAR